MLTSNLHAQKKNIVESIEIDGLIIDETITKMGHDFYEYFYSNWTAPEFSENYTIFIKEKPLPGLGTQVTLKINEDDVFIGRLQPRRQIIEANGDYAIQLCYQYLLNYEMIQKQLEAEDQKGSGIY